MTFNEAIEHLMNGQKVRSVLWHPCYYIEIDNDKESCYKIIREVYNDIDRKYREITKETLDYKAYFSLKDISSEWEIYSDNLMPLRNKN
jgi:hypothetical protein